MSDVGTGAAPSGAATATTGGPSVFDQAGDVLDRVGDKAGEYADKLGDKAAEYADKLGDKASEYADKFGDAVVSGAQATGRFAEHVVDRIRNNAEIVEDRGTTTIANEVVEKVAAIATREVEGVYDLGGDVARLFSQLRDKVGLGDASESADQGVSVRLEGKKASVHITIVIEYGYVVYTVGEKVRANVISSVEKMLGLEVTEVNLLVDDVHVTKVPGPAVPGQAAPTA
jgi:uncharacterized alkaline shock family protein YloU